MTTPLNDNRVQQTGDVTPGHFAKWTTDGVIEDAFDTDPASFGGSLIAGATLSPIGPTDTTGYFYFPTVSGPPTGVPDTQGATVAAVYDPNTNKLWIYNSGWRSVQFA